jgi:fermentation-respiration switch protein FrsA (DUF1100 family)
MNRPMVALLIACTLVIGLLALMWAGQRRLIYFPASDVLAPETVGLARAEPVNFTTADGVVLNGWFLRASRTPAWFTIVVFNGNAGNRAYRAPLARALVAHNLSVLLFDYRGFGENAGAPTEAGLASDARAARAYLASRADVDLARLVYVGESLGSAVATTLASEKPPAALVLRSPFTSMTEIGRVHYPFLPVGWLLRDRFATIDRIGPLRCPLLVIAGDGDRIVPVDQSRRVAEAARAATLVVLPGVDHNDYELLAGDEMIEAIVTFLRRVV